MAVLDVVDRVFARLFNSQVQVEVHLAVGGAGQKEKAHRIRPHILDDLPQSDDVARTLGEAHHLASTLEGDQLIDEKG